MKGSRLKGKCKLSRLYIAIIACTFYSQAFAHEIDALTLDNTHNTQATSQGLNEKKTNVTYLANSIYTTMGRKSSKQFLDNKDFANTSLLPSRLVGIINKNPWQASPFMPVPKRDISCYYGVPSYKESVEYDINTTPVTLEADSIQGSIDNTIIYEGNVLISQADNKLKTDKSTYDSKHKTLLSEGTSVYESGSYTIDTKSPIHTDLNTHITTLNNVNYQLNGSVARGSTKKIALNNKSNTAKLENIKFSTCPKNDETWSIEASKVNLDKNSSFGQAYDAKLYIKDVPVFYFPYINFPITNERKSGLLYPSGSFSSQDGITFAQPVYFNIAQNYDMTFTPQVMGRRGFMLSNEFRYMPIKDTSGVLNVIYLPNDTSWEPNQALGDNQRFLIDLKHTSAFFNQDLTFDIDYEQVRSKDYSFISDIGPDNIAVTDDFITRKFKSTYDREDYNIGLEVLKYQSLIPEDVLVARPFSITPRLTGEYAHVGGPFIFKASTEMTRFTSPHAREFKDFNASRVHIEPSIEYQILNSRGTSLSASGTYFYTHYKQDELERLPSFYKSYLGFKNIDSTVDRNLYMLNVRGKTTFERKVLDLRHTQTLEPEFEYRFIPYKNQNNILNYDTTDRQSDYYSNFSYRNFMGLDRIADNNSITGGFTSRILDAHDREIYRLSISQTYSFEPTRVKLHPIDSPKKYPRSPLAIEFNAAPIEDVTAHASLSYTNDTNEIRNWNAFLEYQNIDGYMAQIGYRYSRDGNRTYDTNAIVDLSQMSLQGIVPLGPNMKFIAATYYDLEQSNNIDSKFALRYEDCCYSITGMYENYTKTDWTHLGRKRDKVIGVQFELKGLGAFNVSGDNDPTNTNTHLIPYFNPTNLNR